MYHLLQTKHVCIESHYLTIQKKIFLDRCVFLKNKMDRLFILSLLALLMVTSYRAAGETSYRELDILGELENLDVPQDDIDDDVTFFDFSLFTSQFSGKNLVNVDSFGAAGDGVSDDTQVRLTYLYAPKPPLI